MAEIEALAFATGITEGERFELSESGVIDFGSLWLRFRHEGIVYPGGASALSAVEVTPARQGLVDLAAHLSDTAAASERAAWEFESIAIKVDRNGPYQDSNTMEWLGAFDLAAVAGEGCILLEGSAARAYANDATQVGDEYQNRYRTVEEDDVIGISLAGTGFDDLGTAER